MNERWYYTIIIDGQIDVRWSHWFEGFDVVPLDDGTTCLSGLVVDQAAFYGLVSRIRDLGLEIIRIEREEEPKDMQGQP